MVHYCCAIECRNERIPGGSVKFHRFPMKNPELLKLWVQALRRENFQPTVHSKICSQHFNLNDYIASSKNNNILKKDAVPSVFNFCEKPKTKCVLMKADVMQETTTEMQCEYPSGSNERKDVAVQTCPVSSASSPTTEKLRKRIKILQQKMRRQNVQLGN